MRPLPRLLPVLLSFLATSALAQTQAPTLEERMSQAELRAAGLDQLSPEQLKYLNEWLRTHGGAGGPAVGPGGVPMFYADDSARDTVEGHIDGPFLGWRGKTVFKLDNGQEWQQAESGMFDAGKMNSPAVRIKPMILGSWLMYVDGCGCSVRVQRIK